MTQSTAAGGSRVLVTGGASGLGLALVRRFAARGDRVLATDLAAEVEGLPHGVAYRRLDVTSDADWDAAMEDVQQRWGGLDVLVNNAGIAASGRIDRLDMDHWHRLFEINLFGVVRGCRAATPLFKAQGEGYLVNVASLAGLIASPGMSSYNAAKAAVVALSESLNHELEPYGITVTAVCPGFFRSHLVASLTGEDPEMDRTARRFLDTAETTADDVAAAVLEGMEQRAQVVLPDPAARESAALKWHDPASYRTVMLGTARRIREKEQADAAAAE